ncbi:MAG: PorT family protein [Bacteroidota bacterium]|nr:PorT family protein [Bacteroidota bacterium]
MKKSLLLAATVCCFTIAANAQLPHFGGKIGLNFADFHGSDASSIDGHGTRTGLVVGAYMTYDFIPLIGIQPEVLYSMKGTSGSTQGVDYTFSANYIEVPVLLKLNIPMAPGTPVKVNVYAGPDFAFNVASSVEASGNGQSQTTDESNNTKGFDFNLAFGGGVGFGIGPATLGLDLRYSLGTGTIDKTGGDIKNGVFALMATVGF